jgi:hypothetical protein
MTITIDDQLLKENINTDLTNDGKKKSIINIQDFGLSAASQQTVGGQPIIRAIFRKHTLFIKNIKDFNVESKSY